MKEGSIYHKDRVVLNVCTPYGRTAKYVKQKDKKLKGEIDKSITIIVGDINIPLSTDRVIRKSVRA